MSSLISRCSHSLRYFDLIQIKEELSIKLRNVRRTVVRLSSATQYPLFLAPKMSLGLIQPPIQWAPLPSVKRRSHLVSRLRMNGTILPPPHTLHGEYRGIFTLLWYMNTGHTISFRLHPYASHSLCYALSQCSLPAGVELCIGGLLIVPCDRMRGNNELERMWMEEAVIKFEATIFDVLTLVNVFLNIAFSW